MDSYQQLGRYLLIKKIARGGMADVYRAKLIGVEGFEKDVAIKKILPHWSSSREFVDMLIDEAKILLHLTHSNIVQVYELNKEADSYYIAMEYVHGIDLKTLLQALEKKSELISLSLLVYLMEQVCLGLKYAHEKKDDHQKNLGIVHRDISPQNILLSYDGEVKITDFGIAKVIGRTNETATGVLKGKFAYMAPEQALGKGIDHRCDIFALGILMYELATGHPCFKGNNDLETLEAVKNAPIIFPDTVRKLPEEFQRIITKALSRNILERYQTIAELLKDLELFARQEALHPHSDELCELLHLIFKEQLASQQVLNQELTLKSKEILKTLIPAKTYSWRQTKVLEAPMSPPTRILEKTLVYLKGMPHKVSLSKVIGGLVFLGIFIFVLKMFLGDKPNDFIPNAWSYIQKNWMVFSSPLIAGSSSSMVMDRISQTEGEKDFSLMPAPLTSPRKITVFGGVVVSARPWGRVYITGIVNGHEAPFSNQKIPVGEYQLKVVYPPHGKVVSTRIQVRENSTIRCQALFGASSQIYCK